MTETETEIVVMPGEQLNGKITGIAPFGAFVSLDGGGTALVHISEISKEFVSDISQFLKIGQDVRVLILSIDTEARISASIKRAVPEKKESTPADFEDMMKKYMKTSGERLNDLKRSQEPKTSGRTRHYSGKH